METRTLSYNIEESDSNCQSQRLMAIQFKESTAMIS